MQIPVPGTNSTRPLTHADITAVSKVEETERDDLFFSMAFSYMQGISIIYGSHEQKLKMSRLYIFKWDTREKII